MFVDGKYTEPICGICALSRTNAYHGIKIRKFRGEMAESARLDAIEWRKIHPEEKPK